MTNNFPTDDSALPDGSPNDQMLPQRIAADHSNRSASIGSSPAAFFAG